jgi:carbamoyltransferase
MITWGISANSHDAALAVFTDDGLEFASHAERFSGVKNDAHLNKEIINYARQWGEPDEIIWYERPFRKTLRQIRAGQGFRLAENNVNHYLRQYGISAPIRYTDHHLAHAAAGFYTSPFTEASVVVIDSIGEFDTLTIWNANDQGLKKIYKQTYPHSVGLWYSAFTQRLGLKPQEDEYILMGMAAYGDPLRFFDEILHEFFHPLDDDSLKQIFFNKPTIKLKHNLHRGCQWWRPDLTTEQDMFDIAAAVQAIYSYLLKYISNWARWKSPSGNLVLMGGCALNCSANGSIKSDWNDMWIMPNPGDAGSAIGAVLAHKKQPLPMPHAFIGYNIEGEYPVEETISELKKTGIVGVANGRAEFGPRAFGNRSLLADPRGDSIKQTVNNIKKRQQFRPFAPVVLEEHASENFEGYYNNYMQFTSKCKNPDLYPAICHTDGTSRVQTVPKDGSGIRRLLETWYAETGCPMLLNTSLNIKGKPIVNTVEDAVAFEKYYGVRVCTAAATK